MQAILRIRNLGGIELDDLVTIQSVAGKLQRIKTQPGVDPQQVDAVFPGFAVLETSPPHLHGDGAPAFHPNQRGRVVLHVKRPFRIDLASSPIHLTQAARAKLRVGVGRDRVDIKFFEQMKASIQQMHPQIRQTAASGKLLLREPRTDPGNARPPEPEATAPVPFPSRTAPSCASARRRSGRSA